MIFFGVEIGNGALFDAKCPNVNHIFSFNHNHFKWVTWNFGIILDGGHFEWNGPFHVQNY